MEKPNFETVKGLPAAMSMNLGVMVALQVLAVLVIDSDEKRAKVALMIEAVSEQAFSAGLDPERLQGFLAGLTALGSASAHSA